MVPHVAAEPPPGWLAADVAAPRIAESAGAEWTSFRASHPTDEAAALVSGCVATPIPGWVEDMRPAVEWRTTALAGAAAERITGVPMDARADTRGTFSLRAASQLQGPAIGMARTFVGFDASRVFTCFVTCAARAPGEAVGERLDCERSVIEATLEGSTPPPRAGLALRGVTWAVHHPRPAAVGGGALVAAVGMLAVITRRRPRSRLG
jgi:hypothetical protein